VTVAGALALADALLSVATLALLFAGYRAIRRGDERAHRARMIGAFACSAAFLAVFVYRFVTYGFHPFAGTGATKVAYYVLLFAHEPIAVLSIPMAIATLVLGLTRARVHREVARPTLWVWSLSAATGVVLYAFLYLPPLG
jgi:putative membrane protein